FKNEENIWSTEGSITNSPGNLCLHLCGNINHFLGATLGNTGYVRNREMEFAVKNVSREELMNNVDETIAVIEKVLGAMKKENLNDVYPLDKFGENATIDFILARLVSHLAYHVGQINYYRRIIEK
ncbi:MAG: DUF1572 family protein, partial [Ignavibacteria bacterium]